MIRSRRLTAFDRFFLASHLGLLNRGLPGNPVLIRLELCGRLDHDELRQAVAGAMNAHPLTFACIRYSRLTGRARWLLNDAPAPTAGDVPVSCHDLSQDDSPDEAQQAALLVAWRRPRDPCATPQIELLHFRMG
ncbi:MAG: hypothetical protein V3T70_11805, partial [Phycisphaerae bacterium]